MATYTLSPKYKKSAIEITYWEKDGVTVVYREGYRSGTFYCESDTRPDIDLATNDELYLDSADAGTDDCWYLEELWDGCWSDWEFPDDMPQEEQERIQALWEEDTYSGMEEDGWINSETEYVFDGPLRMECDGVEIGDDGEVVEDEDDEQEQSSPSEGLSPSAAWPFPSVSPPTDDETKRDENGVVIQSGGKPIWPF